MSCADVMACADPMICGFQMAGDPRRYKGLGNTSWHASAWHHGARRSQEVHRPRDPADPEAKLTSLVWLVLTHGARPSHNLRR